MCLACLRRNKEANVTGMDSNDVEPHRLFTLRNMAFTLNKRHHEKICFFFFLEDHSQVSVQRRNYKEVRMETISVAM